MGKRTEWTAAEIFGYVRANGGNITKAASHMSKDYADERSKVSRQNLQTWINEGSDSNAQDEMDGAELGRKARLYQNRSLELSRQVRRLTDEQNTREAVLDALKDAVSEVGTLAAARHRLPMVEFDASGRPITIELLFSDLQIGKLMNDYDSKVARRRVQEWTSVVRSRIEQYRVQGYKVERIVLAFLGDIIESDKKHSNSGRACDIGTADQMKQAIELMFNDVIMELAMGIPMDVIMVTGNHDHDGHGLNMFNPGREHLSWPVYHAVRMLTAEVIDYANFYIPEGSFHVHELYGQKILYEHGVGVATSGAALKKHVGNRIDQLKHYISMFRMGDKHNISRFNNDRFVVNGAFFGDGRSGEEYSSIAGYDGEPAQLMFAHVQRKDNFRTSMFDSLAIQLGHIK